MSDANRDTILAEIEPLFEEAKRTGKWFWCNYQDLWFSPAELRKAHKDGRFIWGVVNWKLRDPQEMIEGAVRRVNAAQSELSRLNQRIAEQP